MFTEIVLSIFETGVNKSTKYFTYGAFIALIFTLGLMLTFAEFNIHLLVMLLLSTGLLIGLIWLVLFIIASCLRSCQYSAVYPNK